MTPPTLLDRDKEAVMEAPEKILTVYEPPPIPTRAFDWRAWREFNDRLTGWGGTEQAAIDELREIEGSFCRHCKRDEHPRILTCHMGGCPVGADL